MTNQLIKEKIKEFRLKAPNSLNHKTISDIEQFLKTSLNEVQQEEGKRILEGIEKLFNEEGDIDFIKKEIKKIINKV